VAGEALIGQSGERRPSVIVISFSNLSTDPRVNRQIRFLAPGYDVIAVGLGAPNLPGVQFIPVAFSGKSIGGKLLSISQLLLRSFEGYYWRQGHIVDALTKLDGVRADVVIANDIDALPLALRVARGARVIFDAHEYAPLEWEDQWLFRHFFQDYRTHLCARYIPRVHSMMTVCRSIAELYARDTGVTPAVVTNAPDYEDLEPSPAHPASGRIRLVHHGGVSRSRKLENMILMMDHLDDRFELDFLLPTPPEVEAYVAELRTLAQGKRVRFLAPVPMRELSRFLSQYDIGVYILPPTNLNNRFALPNKFFEFIQARLAVAVGPSPEMARIVEEHDCGVVARDFTPAALAERLVQLDAERIAHFKRRAHEAAWELSAERNRKVVLEMVEVAVAG
jgi:hypothetical protein